MAVQREIVDKDGNRLAVVQGGAGKAAVYGKTAAGEWVPLQVDADGRAVLNVGEVSATIGVIEQGAAGEDPWLVQLSGKIVEEIVLFNQMEIRDTEIYNSVVIPSTVLSKIRDFDIFITDTNTHESTVKPAMSLSFHPHTLEPDTSFLSFKPDNKNTLYSWRVAPLDIAARHTLVTEIPELSGPWFASAPYTPYLNMSVWYLLGIANVRFYNRMTEVVDDELNDRTKFLNTIKSSVLNAGIDLRMRIRYLTAPTMGSITAKFRGIV